MTKKATHNQLIFDATLGALTIKLADICTGDSTSCPFNADYRWNCPFEGKCWDVSPAQWLDFFEAMLSPNPPLLTDDQIALWTKGDNETSKPPTCAMNVFNNLFSPESRLDQ